MLTAQKVMFIKGIDPRALTGNSFSILQMFVSIKTQEMKLKNI